MKRQQTSFNRLECYSGRFPPGPPGTQTLSPGKRRTRSSFITPISEFALRPRPAHSPAKLPNPIQAYPLHSITDPAIETTLKAAITEAANGHLPAAIHLYEQILSLHPDYTPARLNLGVVYMKSGHLIEAVEVYTEGLARNTDPRLQYNLAVCYLMNKDPKSALELLNLAENTDSETLKSQITAAKSHIEANFPSKSSQIQSNRRSKSRLSCYYCSDSPKLTTSRTEKTIEVPKSSMWKAFKSIEQFDPKANNQEKGRKRTLIYHVRTKSAQNRPKSSISGIRFGLSERKTPLKGKNRRSEESISSYESEINKGESEEMRRKPPLQRVRKKGSFMQEDLEDEEKLRYLQFDVEQEEQVQKKFSEVQAVVQKEADKLSSATSLIEDVQLERTINGRLTQQALMAIREIFAKDRDQQAEQRLLNILSPLKFFTRFQPEVRLRLFSISHHRRFSPGDVIFSQGEIGELMYIILYGSVNIQKQASDFGEKPLTIGTLYDGDSFGEASVLLMKVKKGSTVRAFSCVAAEECDLLALPKVTYQMIIMQQVETTIEGKLGFLAGLTVFEGIQRVSLVPLATNVEPKQFKFNEVVIRKGDCPSGLHIIMKGICKVYSEAQLSPSTSQDEFASTRVKQTSALRNISLRNYEHPKDTPSQWLLRPNSLSKPLTDAKKQERVLLATLQKGDFFGIRCMQGDDRVKRPEEEIPIEPAKCTIVAESAEVAVLIVTKPQLYYLGEKLAVRCTQEQVKDRLNRAVDYDCPQHVTSRELREDILRWNRYKSGLMDSTYRSLFVGRNKEKIISALRDS